MPHPVQYMERSRLYYEAQGFDKAYVWAHHDDVPFAPLSKPLSESRLSLVTTASRYDRKPLTPRFVDSGDTSPGPDRLYANDLSWDKKATHLDDLGSYFPLTHLNEAVESGRLGAVAERFHCAPTEYSQRKTHAEDAPEIVARVREDAADIALLVPL